MVKRRPPSALQNGEDMDNTQRCGNDSVGDFNRLYVWHRKLPYGICFTGGASYFGRSGRFSMVQSIRVDA